MLEGMLRKEPSERLTLAEIMTHPWVNGEPLQMKVTLAAAATPAATDSESGTYNDRCISVFFFPNCAIILFSFFCSGCVQFLILIVSIVTCSNIGVALRIFYLNEKSGQNATPLKSASEGELYVNLFCDRIFRVLIFFVCNFRC